MTQAEGEFADIDGLRIRIRRQHVEPEAAPPMQVNGQPQRDAEPQLAPDDGWKDFTEPDKRQLVEESMQRFAYAKKLASKAMQEVNVAQDEPTHVKFAALQKSLLHLASADMEDPAAAKALMDIAAACPIALAQAAAQRAEQQAAEQNCASAAQLCEKARARKKELSESLRELQEETAVYQSLRTKLKELKQNNAEVEASLAESSKEREALAAQHKADDARNDQRNVRLVSSCFTCSA